MYACTESAVLNEFIVKYEKAAADQLCNNLLCGGKVV